MTNEERNREALIDHIAEQDRIIRRRNEQIAAQVEIIEEARQERDSWRAQVPLADWEKELIQPAQNPRPLTADDYQRGEMAALAAFVGTELSIPINVLVRAIVTEVLTPPPSRPEGAEELQALIRQAEAEGEGADNEALANYLAARLIDPTVKEKS